MDEEKIYEKMWEHHTGSAPLSPPQSPQYYTPVAKPRFSIMRPSSPQTHDRSSYLPPVPERRLLQESNTSDTSILRDSELSELVPARVSCGAECTASRFSQSDDAGLTNPAFDCPFEDPPDFDMESSDELEAEENIYSDLTDDERLKLVTKSVVSEVIFDGYLLMQYGIKSWHRRYLQLTNTEIFIFPKRSSKVSKRILPLYCIRDVNSLDEKDKMRLFITSHKTYDFKTDTSGEEATSSNSKIKMTSVWADHILRAITQRDCSADAAETEQKEDLGWIKISGRPKRRFALNRKCHYLAYYRSDEEYDNHIAAHRIDLKTCIIKRVSGTKNSAEIFSALLRLTLHFNDEISCQKFVDKVSRASQSAWNLEPLTLSRTVSANPEENDKVLKAVYSNKSNANCADCGASDPEWASINMCITLCSNCSGWHRRLGSDYSKVQGLRLDVRVWSEEIITLFQRVGNDVANKFWVADPKHRKISSQFTSDDDRRNYIIGKYVKKEFIDKTHLENFSDHLEILLRVIATRKQIPSGIDMEDPILKKFFDLNRSVYEDNIQSGSCVFEGEQFWLSLRSSGTLCFFDKSMTGKHRVQCSDLVFVEAYKHRLVLSTDSKDYVVMMKDGLEEWWQFISGNAFNILDDEQLSFVNPLQLIAKCTFRVIEHSGDNFEGHLLIGSNVMWIKSKALQDSLPYNPHTLDELQILDLRKISYIHFNSSNPNILHLKMPIPFLEESSVCTIQIEFRRPLHREEIKKMVVDAVACGDSLEQQGLDVSGVPIIVAKCLECVALYGLKTEGIYRKSVNKVEMEACLESYKENPLKFELKNETDEHIYLACCVLKKFLRELKEIPLTEKLWRKLVEPFLSKSEPVTSLIKSTLRLLPLANYETLKALVFHTALVVSYSEFNKMSCDNLSIIFSTNIGPGDDMAVAMPIANFFKHLVDKKDYYFDIDQSEIVAAKDLFSKREQLTGRNNELVVGRSTTSNNMLHYVYLEDERDASVGINIQAGTDAEEIVTMIKENHSSKLHHKCPYSACFLFETMEPPEDDTATESELFELRLVTEMERLVHPTELIQSILSRWTQWSKNDLKYYSSRMRFRVRTFTNPPCWPCLYEDSIIIDTYFVDNLKVDWCTNKKKWNSGSLKLQPSEQGFGMYLEKPPLGRPLPGNFGGTTIPFNSAGCLIFAGLDMRRLKDKSKDRRARAFTLVPIHLDSKNAASDEGYLGRAVVLENQNPSQFRSIFTELWRRWHKPMPPIRS